MLRLETRVNKQDFPRRLVHASNNTVNPSENNSDFIVWGNDLAAYGPVALLTLADWIKDERVTPDTWIFDAKSQNWQPAAQVPQLQQYFPVAPVVAAASAGVESLSPAGVTIKPATLRRIKILAGLSDAQLERFAKFMQLEKVHQWTQIVRQGDLSDAMYLVLEGELRVRLLVGGKESILATLSAGEFFGDISLFDHGPRSADVIANTDSLLLKITSAAFDKLSKEAPELAAPFLFAVGKTLTARMRADNKRYRDTIYFARTASGG